MAIEKIFSFLVQPAKGADDPPDISGTSVPLRGKLFDLIGGLYETADVDCKIEIVFASENGDQENARRTQILEYLTQPTLPNARHLARALQAVTDKRSGLGLLFVASGVDDDDRERIVLARFPADQGVLAHEDARSLTIQFLERVFMKSAHSYKSATFVGASLEKGEFWTGRAVDKQVNAGKELSRYWIGEFLQARLLSTPAAGTKRFAKAVSDAIRTTDDPAVRTALVSMATLLAGQEGKQVTPQSIAVDFGLTPAATSALEQAMPRPELFTQSFEIDAEELSRQVGYRMLELDNGAIVMADNKRFEEVFVREQVDGETTRFSTIGRVVREQLRKAI